MSAHVILASKSALLDKYGDPVAKTVADVLQKTATRSRRVRRSVIYVDHPADMAGLGLDAIYGAVKDSDIRAVVSALHDRLRPRSILLVGARDIFPHQRIVNRDPDGVDGKTIFSDTPLSFARSQPADGDVYDWPDLRPPTTAVARLAGPVNQKTPDALVAQVEALLAPSPSMEGGLVANTLFIASDDKAPEAGFTKAHSFPLGGGLYILNANQMHFLRSAMGTRLQFVSCHSAIGNAYHHKLGASACKAALWAPDVPKEMHGVAAMYLSCWGGFQHEWDPLAEDPWDKVPPLCEAYMAAGATAFVGSLSTTYTQATAPRLFANGLALYFLRALRRGRTLGQAFVGAHRRLWARAWRGGDLLTARKTLMQFTMLGDPTARMTRRGTAPPTLPAPPSVPDALPLVTVRTPVEPLRSAERALPDNFDGIVSQMRTTAAARFGAQLTSLQGYRLPQTADGAWAVVVGAARRTGDPADPKAKNPADRTPSRWVVSAWVHRERLIHLDLLRQG